jgi:hypothetical protein
MRSTRSALAAEMASLGRASDVNLHFHLDSDRDSSPIFLPIVPSLSYNHYTDFQGHVRSTLVLEMGDRS